MTLLAQSFASPVALASSSAFGPRSFVALDEHILAGGNGVVLARSPVMETALAAGAHIARRVGAQKFLPLQVKARAGAPLWREVASLLGMARLPCEPSACADEIASTATLRRAVIIAPLPRAGTWDRAVAIELTRLAAAPLIVFLSDADESALDVHGEVFDVGASLDAVEMQRWWGAIAEQAHAEFVTDDLAALDSWWAATRRTAVPIEPARRDVPAVTKPFFLALALAGRSWPVADVAVLGGDRLSLDDLDRAGAVRVARGWISIEPGWEECASRCEETATAADIAGVAAALMARHPTDPWAQARAAELLVRADAGDAADSAHAAALACADDGVARRELVARWMRTLERCPRGSQLVLRLRAAERALAVGEAEEAYGWAQTAVGVAPNDPAVTLLLGRAAVALGDLVAAKVALERGRAVASTTEAGALIAVELSEVAYLSGDLPGAKTDAEAALATTNDASTKLKARNTLGKILLAEARWDEADRHFAEDAWTASSAGLVTAELRARLNRGIALLSKGLADEARAMFEAVHAEGERIGDARACAFALDNLAVVATIRHDYAGALVLSERTLKLRQRLGDRLTTARILANLAELRRKLGLLDHADHAIAFGRRTLGPGMPPARSARFSIVAAKTALMRGNSAEATREIARAIIDFESAGMREFVGEAHRVAARIALEDGDLARASDTLTRARELSTTDEARAEVMLLTALHSRASGENDESLAVQALTLARSVGEEELLIEAHTLLCEMHRAHGNLEASRAHLEQATSLRDHVATTLTHDVRSAFLARRDLVALGHLQTLMSESAVEADEPKASARAPFDSGRMAIGTPRDFVGDDPTVRALLAAVKKVARSSSTILIRGESGTGKELVAEAVHRASERATGPLVTVNCAALVETLLLSELFGHEKGAFTGATARRRGRFEMAEGGTLFLDEIGDISPRTQVALLRVLQERTFERVGGTAAIRANVRIICATHRDLRAMVERGEFREDLYYRLRGITLELPALRARLGDLLRISDHLLTRVAGERGETKKLLAADALELLVRHRWPGNVRELENALRAASLFAEGDIINASHLTDNVDDLRAVAQAAPASVRFRSSYAPPALLSDPESSPLPLDVASDVELVDDGHDSADALPLTFEDGPLPSGEASATAIAYAQVRHGSVSLSDIKRQIERDCIARALAETRGNITKAAALLGMKRPRLSQLVKQYGLAAVSSEAL